MKLLLAMQATTQDWPHHKIPSMQTGCSHAGHLSLATGSETNIPSYISARLLICWGDSGKKSQYQAEEQSSSCECRLKKLTPSETQKAKVKGINCWWTLMEGMDVGVLLKCGLVLWKCVGWPGVWDVLWRCEGVLRWAWGSGSTLEVWGCYRDGGVLLEVGQCWRSGGLL